MNEPNDSSRSGDHSSAPADSLEAGQAAGFNAPRSSLGDKGPAPADSALAADTQRTTEPAPAAASTERPHVEAGVLPVVPGYRVLYEIARGGMGRVLAAHDLGLDRDVALKILLPGTSSDRFVRESKITARLPHPGIPPVHALGTLADGSPLLAMKLIAGHTLAAEMKRGDRPRLLQAFLQVCQAVGFAHSRGIIHRDLKPANVMVGAFGEVQVMDWGLAKVMQKDEGGRMKEEKETSEESSSSFLLPPSSLQTDPNQTTDYPAAGPAAAERTEAGTVLGTPGYMAPEQARGEATDARADVFALGGILCAILTGHPPFGGKSSMEVIRRAGEADLAEANARLDRCGSDAELVGLCRRCLSASPAARPANGQAVADALTAYLNGVQERLQGAERERAVALTREAEQRKRRRVQLALATAVVLLVLGAGVFAWWQDRQATERRAEARNKEQQASQGVDANLKLATDLRKQYKFKDAEAALAQAVELARGSAPDRLAEVEQACLDLAFVARLDDIRYRKWTWITQPGSKGMFDPGIAAPAYRQAFAERGLDLTSLDPAGAAKQIRASAVKAELVAAVDDWALFEPEPAIRDRLLDVVRQADPGAWTDCLRDPAVRNDKGALAKLAEDADLARTSAEALCVLAHRMGLLDLDPAPMLTVARTVYPANFELAFALALWHTSRRDDRAIGSYEAARSLRPDNFAVWINLGGALLVKGKIDEAIACYRKVIELDSKSALAHNDLGYALQRAGRTDEAIAAWCHAIELDPKLAVIYANLGSALEDKGQVEEAITNYRKAVNLDPNLVAAQANLGSLLCDVKKDYDGAIACFHKALELDPKRAKIHFNLGNALRDKGQVDKAITCYRKAIELDPKFAAAHYNLGNVLSRRGQMDEGIACWRKAIAADPKFSQAHFSLGLGLFGKEQVDEAIVCFKKATELDPKAPMAHGALGQALLSQGRYAEARDASARALALLPEKHPLRGPASDQVQACERMLRLEEQLPRLLRGEGKASSPEDSLDLAQMCQRKRLHAGAARFSADAFAAAPQLAGDLDAGHRYNAACSAALAAAGQGEDAAKLDDAAKAKLRGQALDWLRADLKARSKLLFSGPPQAQSALVPILSHWRKDSDLAGIRDAAALAKLPAEDRAACERLWADVAAVLKKADPPAKKDTQP
jgi:tetratricopeptide (TPR) repeat protein